MRDFFKALLTDLEILTGFKQLDSMLSGGEQQVTKLLDELTKAAGRYHLPEADKQRLLRASVHHEDFKKMSVTWVMNTLGGPTEAYQRSQEHQERIAKSESADQEALSAEEALPYIQQFKENIDKAQQHFTINHSPKYGGTRIKESWNKNQKP